MRISHWIVAALPLAVGGTSVCDGTKQFYQSMSCCGDSNSQSVCVSPSVSTTTLGIEDCFLAKRTLGVKPDGCADAYPPPKTRVALSGGGVGEDDSPLSAYLESKGGFLLKKIASTKFAQGAIAPDGLYKSGLQNFWHSISVTPEYVLLGVRNTPNFIPSESFGGSSASGVYKFFRGNLSQADVFKGTDNKAVMRYAPVVADGHMFSTHWGYLDPQARFLYKTKIDNFSQYEALDMATHFMAFRGGQGIGGPVASMSMAGDETCGTRLFVNSMSFGYFAPYNDVDQSRPIGLDNLDSHRGRIACICSKTMTTCPGWDNAGGTGVPYYFNGAPHMPTDFATVGSIHINSARSQFLGTVRQVSCTTLTAPVSASRVIFESVDVTLSKSVSEGVILKSATGLVQLKVLSASGTQASLEYYMGHYDTPTDTQAFIDPANASDTVSIVSIQSMKTLHGYAVAVSDAAPPKKFIVAGYTETTTAISSFADTIDFSTSLGSTCANTTVYSAIETLAADSYYPGQPATVVDFSGVTLKYKYALGETLPADSQKSVHSTGANNWVPCSVDEGTKTLLCPFGNAHMLSFDRYQIMKPVLELQRELESLRQAAVVADDKAAFEAVNNRHQEMVTLNLQAMSLLSEYDASFKENAIHAIDIETGALKWATQMEGTDQWFLALQSQSGFDTFWDAKAAGAYGTDVWKDIDANNVRVYNGVVYASTKGGTIAAMDLATGKPLAWHRYGPGTPAGGAAPGNYGGFCVGKTGLVAALGTMTASPSVDTTASGGVVWLTQAGEPVKEDQTRIVVWDAFQQKELWSVTLQGSAAGGIVCLQDTLMAPCQTAKSNFCLYDMRTGAVRQAVLSDSAWSINPMTYMGTSDTIKSVSLLCDGDECFEWNDSERLNKYTMY